MKQECALGKGGGGAELQKRALVQADEKSRRSTRSASPIRNNRCTTQGTIHQMAMRQSRLNPSEPSHPRPEPARPHFVVVRVVSFCAVCFFFLFVSVLHFVERYAHLSRRQHCRSSTNTATRRAVCNVVRHLHWSGAISIHPIHGAAIYCN